MVMFVSLIAAVIIAFLYHKQKPLETPLKELQSDEMNGQQRGEHGEQLVAEQLRLLPGYSKILRNVYLPTSKGSYTEIDLIFIHEQGIFIVESKNYSGTICGEEHERYWEKVLSKDYAVTFYNPIMQNDIHMRAFFKACPQIEQQSCHSVIVFGDQATLKIGAVHNENTYVLKCAHMLALQEVLRYSDWQVDVDRVVSYLEPFHHTSITTKITHVERLQQKYQKRAS